MQVTGSQGSTDRGSSATVEMGGRRGSPATVDQSAKKPRLDGEEPLHGPVKREIVAAEHGPRMEVAVKLDVTVLHCPICLRPFKPSVFQVRLFLCFLVCFRTFDPVTAGAGAPGLMNFFGTRAVQARAPGVRRLPRRGVREER